MKMRSSKNVIKSGAQMQIAKFGFGRKFHDLKYCKVGFFFIFLEFIIHLREPLQNIIEKNQVIINLSYFLDYYLFNITYLHTTCTIPLEYVDFS